MKKSNRANLENKRSIFLQMGLAIALAIVLLAFEWSSVDLINADVYDKGNNDFYEEMVPITKQEIKKPPPPKNIAVEIKVVDNNVDVPDIIIPDIEVNPGDSIEYVPFIDDEVEEVIPFYMVEIVPTFLDGSDGALMSWIADNSTYPPICVSNGVEGIVWVGFTIDGSGKVVNVHLLRMVDPYLDAEALRVIGSMPNWTAGIQGGKKVSVPYQLPVKFILQ